jgi:hypothetical protein
MRAIPGDRVKLRLDHAPLGKWAGGLNWVQTPVADMGWSSDTGAEAFIDRNLTTTSSPGTQFIFSSFLRISAASLPSGATASYLV